MTLQRGGDPLARIEVSSKFKDTSPFVSIIARDRPLPELARQMLAAPDATMKAKLSAGRRLLDIGELTMTGVKLHVRACVDARGDMARGVFWVDGAALSAGFEFQDGMRNVKPLAGQKWFGEHSPLCDDPAHLPPD